MEDCVHVIRYLSPVINNIRLNGELLLHIWKTQLIWLPCRSAGHVTLKGIHGTFTLLCFIIPVVSLQSNQWSE